jgi:predicted dehydrogenase
MKPLSNPVSAITPTMPRRDFIKASAGLALGAALSHYSLSAAERRRSIGANDRIRIGLIGCGERGRTAHLPGIYQHLQQTNFEVVALCDPWRVQREQANALVKEWFGRDAKLCTNHRELLDLKDVDAVMIASPDHHHTTHLEASARAGKHIYVEKPLAMELPKLLRAVDAVKEAGTTVQVGTQLRSLPGIVGARDLYKSGALGKFARIEEIRNGDRPYWYNYLERTVKAEDVDWKEFLGDRPMRPFNPKHLAAWYGYYEFCQGPVPQWGAHFLDMVHFITGASFPESCVCTGGTFTWADEHAFTVPDTVQATWIYPEGFMLSSGNYFGNGSVDSRKFYSDRGVLNVDNWNAPTYSPDGGSRRDGTIRGKNDVPMLERPDHFLDWLQCMRSGATPHAPIEAGFQHAIAVLMATTAFETGRKTTYDPKTRRIQTA